MASTPTTVAVFGLGLMGSRIAGHLARAGWTVRGHDPRPDARVALEAAGGIFCADAMAALGLGHFAVLSLPSSAAFRTVVERLAGTLAPPRYVVDTSTLSLADKEWARDRLSRASVDFLDCPISGTAAQADTRDVVVYASGADEAITTTLPLLESFSRRVYRVGPCGAGTKLKLVANLLVAVHNVAAAEAINLARKAGLDGDLVVRAIADGAGGSRMLEVRGPMMVCRQYEPATMKIEVFLKDLGLIEAFSDACGAATPLLEVAHRLYRAAAAEGMAALDTAAVGALIESTDR